MNPNENLNEFNGFYYELIKQVLSNVKDAFMDDGADSEALSQLKLRWEHKLKSSEMIGRQRIITYKKTPNERPVVVVIRHE